MISHHAKGVKYLFIGFLFVWLGISIPVYQYASFDILVNAIGYFVILKGLRLLEIKAMVLFTLGRILLLISLLDIISFSHSLTYYFSIFESVVQLVFIALLGRDLVNLAKKYLYETETKAMIRWYLGVVIVAQFGLTFVINLDEVLSIPFSFFMVGTIFLMNLILLLFFYRLRKRIIKVANSKMAEKSDDDLGFDEVDGAFENGD